MRLSFAVAVLLAANLQAQPSPTDRYRYAPLVATAKLWNMIRYLHPRVTGNSTEWDAALLAALPKIEAVRSDQELAVALDAMLGTLHDPCTRIALGLPGTGISVESVEPDTMVIHAGNGDLSNSLGAGLMIQMGIPQTNTIVWDLRGSRLPFSLSTRPSLRELRLHGLGYAYRQHTGYASEDATGSRRYFSSLEIVESQPASLKQPRTRRQVYLVNRDSAVPVEAILEQIEGRTAILSEDPPGLRQAGFTELVPILGRVVAEVRVAELRYADATTEFAPTRVMLNRGEDAVKAAVAIAASGEWGMPGERPRFDPGAAWFRDIPYADPAYPNREMRILAAMRIWGIFHYFSPEISLAGQKWDETLTEFLPKFADAADARQYHLAAAEMVARAGDPNGYANSPVISAYLGTAGPPFEVRWVEGQPVVSHVFKKNPAQPGDIILQIDGQPAEKRLGELARYVSNASQENGRAKELRLLLRRSSGGMLNLTVRGKDGSERNIAFEVNAANEKVIPAHRSGEAVRLIDGRFGYADLERMEPSEADAVFTKFQQTPAIIFDLRGVPREKSLAMASRLSDGSEPAAAEILRNVVGLGQEGTHIHQTQSVLRVPRNSGQRYTGKTVALVDETSSRLADWCAMQMKAANGTMLIGSANFAGIPDTSAVFDVPGGIKVYFTGDMARWPNGKPLYTEGVRPDVEARPTIAGIRTGRDEVLDAAIQYLSR